MLPEDIQKQYDISRKRAIDEAEKRKEMAYRASPRLKEIDGEIRDISFKLGIELVNAKDRDAVRHRTAEKLELLTRERNELLKQNKLDGSCLKPRYNCPKCGDTGFLPNGGLCPCARMKLAGRRYASSGISENAGFDRFDSSIFKDAEQLKRTQKAAKICREYAQSLEYNGAHGLLLMGETGLGKTFLIDCIGREAIERGFGVKKYTAYNLIDATLRALRARTAGPELAEADLLMIDDLGTEPMVPGITIETLFALINERQFSGKATVIATNLTKNDIYEQYGERIISRLFASREFAAITLKGNDLRV